MTARLPHLVASEIRAEMARQRMTQRQLAERLGLPQPSISKRLAGHIAFDVAELEQVADALGVPVTQFLPTEPEAQSSGSTGPRPTGPGPQSPGPVRPTGPTPPTRATEPAASHGRG